MINFTVHDRDSAPDASKPLIDKAQEAFGLVPSLHGVMAQSPQLLEAYQVLSNLFNQCSLNKEQRHVVWLTVAMNNQCHYCVPAHSQLATLDGLDPDIIQAIRSDQPINDKPLEALRQYTSSVVFNRGKVSVDEITAMINLGFTQQNLLDINLGVAHKVLSNYTNYLAKTPIDEPFLPFTGF